MTRMPPFQRLLAAALVLALPLAQGCSLFTGSRQSVIIAPSDPSAEVFVDGRPVGQGTVAVDLRRNRSHGVMARVGERVGTAHIGTEISTTGILDLIGGIFFLVPFIGVLGPGFYSLDADYVNVVVPAAPR